MFLALLMTFVTLVAWWLSFKLRLIPGRLSLLEAFVLGHIPFLIAGVFAAVSILRTNVAEDARLLGLYLLTMAFSLFGALWARRHLAGRIARLGTPTWAGQKDATVLGWTTIAAAGIAFFALWYHPIPIADRLMMPRFRRLLPTDQVTTFGEFTALLTPLMVAVVATMFGASRSRRGWLAIVLLAVSPIFVLCRLVELSRGGILQLLLGILIVSWYFGSKRLRLAAAVISGALVLAMVPFSAWLSTYRGTLDIGSANSHVASGEWVFSATEDMSVATAEICIKTIDAYSFPENSLYWEGVGQIIFFFVPRTIWPEKPMVFGQRVWEEVLGGSSFAVLGVGPTFMAEAYAVAGPVSLLLFSWFLGAFFVWFEYQCWRRLPQREAAAFLVCCAYSAATVARGDFRSAWVRAFILLPLAYVTVRGITVFVHRVGRYGDWVVAPPREARRDTNLVESGTARAAIVNQGD